VSKIISFHSFMFGDYKSVKHSYRQYLTTFTVYIAFKSAYVVQWLERRHRGMVILTSPVRIHCGTLVPVDETV
jgi:hypothetical protein